VLLFVMHTQSRRRRRALRATVAGTLHDVDTDGAGRPRSDAALFAAHLVEAGDDPADRAEHLRRCRPCAKVTGDLRAGHPVDPDLELRLLDVFREWRDA
jgi:hypothetical protein